MFFPQPRHERVSFFASDLTVLKRVLNRIGRPECRIKAFRVTFLDAERRRMHVPTRSVGTRELAFLQPVDVSQQRRLEHVQIVAEDIREIGETLLRRVGL
jgi:hypothetical protein